FDNSAEGTHAPRWLFPSELDLSGHVSLIASGTNHTSGAIAINELRDLLQWRLQTANVMPTPWGATGFGHGDRGDFWLNGPSLYGISPWPGGPTTRYQSLTLQDELALRWREGLKREAVHSP